MHDRINTLVHICPFCSEPKPSLRALATHRRLCKSNPNRVTTPFQSSVWQKSKGTNQYLKAKAEGRPTPVVSAQTRLKISIAHCALPKKPDDGSLRHYRSRCAFKFNAWSYPAEFDLDLIQRFGLYRASNRGNNLNGVSRDHMLSVKDGFLQKIDPEILAHPANCKLLRHSDNVRKHKRSSISLKHLQKRIVDWDNRYNTTGL